jgi:hypothetical protein
MTATSAEHPHVSTTNLGTQLQLGTPASASPLSPSKVTMSANPASGFFDALEAPPVSRDMGKTPDFGIPSTRHPSGGLAGAAPVKSIPDICGEHTEPGSPQDGERRFACQSVLESAPVYAEGGFELSSTGSEQHPLVELAKKAIAALQVDQDPVKFADCFDQGAEIIRHSIAHGKTVEKIVGREGFEEFARGG